jgi:transposase
MRKHTPLSEKDTAEVLEKAFKNTQDSDLKIRIKAIFLRKKNKTPVEIAGQLLVSDRSVRGWILRYNEGGLSALSTKPSGRAEGNPIWDAALFTDLAKEIDEGGYWSIPRMQEWIKKNHQKDIPEQTVWYRMNQLEYSYKSSRPSPIGGSKEKQTAFKKGASAHSWSRLQTTHSNSSLQTR